MTDQTDACWDLMPKLIEDVRRVGQALAMPYIAAQSDLGDPEPMSDRDGRPYAETTFEWLDPDHRYWQDRKLALRVPFLAAARVFSEPFYYTQGRLYSWRPTALLDVIDCRPELHSENLGEAVVAPVHMPGGLVGAILWCSREPVDVARRFAEHAEHLHAAATRLVTTHVEARGQARLDAAPHRLTRREVQCLRWAAAGKTDPEIGIILTLSVSTVRFHLRNAAGKLGASGRSSAIQKAAGLGFVGARLA